MNKLEAVKTSSFRTATYKQLFTSLGTVAPRFSVLSIRTAQARIAKITLIFLRGIIGVCTFRVEA